MAYACITESKNCREVPRVLRETNSFITYITSVRLVLLGSFLLLYRPINSGEEAKDVCSKYTRSPLLRRIFNPPKLIGSEKATYSLFRTMVQRTHLPNNFFIYNKKYFSSSSRLIYLLWWKDFSSPGRWILLPPVDGFFFPR